MKLKEWRIKTILLLGLTGWGLLCYLIYTSLYSEQKGLLLIDFNSKNELLFELILFPIVFLVIGYIGATHWAEVKVYNEIRSI
jgi:hypothetical protein